MKLSRKLIPAFAMLLVSAIMMTTASYAWFSINRATNVQGMSVSTVAADNILIADSTLEATTKADEATFGSDLTDTMSAVLTPVSTIDGENFYYTDGKNVTGTGDAKEEEYVLYNAGDLDGFHDVYGNDDAVGYIDYVFQIKASNADTVNAKDLKITAIDLKYSGETDAQTAFRAAVFSQKFNTNFAAGVGTLVTILDPTSAENFTANNAVSSTTATASIPKADAAATLGSVTAGETEYFKVVVRLWLEGEDKTCNNDTFADLVDGSWALTMVIEIGGETAAVTALGTSTTPAP